MSPVTVHVFIRKQTRSEHFSEQPSKSIIVSHRHLVRKLDLVKVTSLPVKRSLEMTLIDLTPAYA